jgi:hypothetical protein
MCPLITRNCKSLCYYITNTTVDLWWSNQSWPPLPSFMYSRCSIQLKFRDQCAQAPAILNEMFENLSTSQHSYNLWSEYFHNFFLNPVQIWQRRDSRTSQTTSKWSRYLSRVLYTQSGILTGKDWLKPRSYDSHRLSCTLINFELVEILIKVE